MPALGTWASADPLAVHAPGKADLNLYAYVTGQLLRATDPVGLDKEGGGSSTSFYPNEAGTAPPAEAPPPAPDGAGGTPAKPAESVVELPEMTISGGGAGGDAGKRGSNGGVEHPVGHGGSPPATAGAHGTNSATGAERVASLTGMLKRDAFLDARSSAPNPFVGKSDFGGEPLKFTVEMAAGHTISKLMAPAGAAAEVESTVEFSTPKSREFVEDLSHATGRTSEVRNAVISEVATTNLSGVNFTHMPRYNPFLEQYGVAVRGQGSQLGGRAFCSRYQVAETMVHEELHHRWWARGITDAHHITGSVREAKPYGIVERLLRMKGMKK